MTLRLFIIVVCYLPILGQFLPTTNFGHGIPDIDAQRLLLYLFLFAFVINLAQKKYGRLVCKWTIILAVFTFVVFQSLLWTKYPLINATRDLLENVFIPFLIAATAIPLFREKSNVQLYIKHITYAALILSYHSIYQMFFDPQQVLGAYRSTSYLHNPNALALFIVLAIPCILYALQNNLLPKKTSLIVLSIVQIAVISTMSRKGILTMLITFTLYYFLMRQKKQLMIMLALLLIISSSFFTYLTLMPVQRFNPDAMESNIKSRLYRDSIGLKMFLSSPIVGLGHRGYQSHYYQYFLHSKRQSYAAHNTYITVLVNYGVIGFLPFLTLLLYPLYSSVKALNNQLKPNNPVHSKQIAIICICSLTTFIIAGYFAGGLLFSRSLMNLFYTNLALFMSSSAKTQIL